MPYRHRTRLLIDADPLIAAALTTEAQRRMVPRSKLLAAILYDYVRAPRDLDEAPIYPAGYAEIDGRYRVHKAKIVQVDARGIVVELAAGVAAVR